MALPTPPESEQGSEPQEQSPEVRLNHISEVLRQSDLEVSSSGTSRSPEQEEWSTAFRQAVGFVAGDAAWPGGAEGWSQTLATNVFDAISNYVPDGWTQDDAEDITASRNSGSEEARSGTSAVAAAEHLKSDEGSQGASSEEKANEIHKRTVRQRFDSLASTSLSDTETKEDGDETSAKSGSASPRGLEAALKELGTYKFDPDRVDRKGQLLISDLPAAPKELPPPVPLREPSLPEDEPVSDVQEEATTWWQRLVAFAPPGCSSCAGPISQEIYRESEECIQEKACCCKPVCWRTRPHVEEHVHTESRLQNF